MGLRGRAFGRLVHHCDAARKQSDASGEQSDAALMHCASARKHYASARKHCDASSDADVSAHPRTCSLSIHFKGVFSTRINAHRLSVLALPTRRVFSSVRQALDPTKPVLGMAVKTLSFEI